MKKLLLFDVDMTLIDSGGAGGRSMSEAFTRLFDRRDGFKNVHFAGRTDAQILKDALRLHGLDWDPEKERAFKELYFELLTAEIKKPNPKKQAKPGVRGLLDLLARREDVGLGLLTGNWRRGADIKLSHFDLYHYFQFGAFSDDSGDRGALPEIAVRRAREITGIQASPEHVYVIGDTPLDVACARPFGARSVAVATGFYSYEQLQDVGPDLVFHDLTDHERFLRMLEGNR